MIADGPRQLSWYKARGCYKKFYRGHVYYLRGDNSGDDPAPAHQPHSS